MVERLEVEILDDADDVCTFDDGGGVGIRQLLTQGIFRTGVAKSACGRTVEQEGGRPVRRREPTARQQAQLQQIDEAGLDVGVSHGHGVDLPRLAHLRRVEEPGRGQELERGGAVYARMLQELLLDTRHPAVESGPLYGEHDDVVLVKSQRPIPHELQLSVDDARGDGHGDGEGELEHH